MYQWLDEVADDKPGQTSRCQPPTSERRGGWDRPRPRTRDRAADMAHSRTNSPGRAPAARRLHAESSPAPRTGGKTSSSGPNSTRPSPCSRVMYVGCCRARRGRPAARRRRRWTAALGRAAALLVHDDTAASRVSSATRRGRGPRRGPVADDRPEQVLAAAARSIHRALQQFPHRPAQRLVAGLGGADVAGRALLLGRRRSRPRSSDGADWRALRQTRPPRWLRIAPAAAPRAPRAPPGSWRATRQRVRASSRPRRAAVTTAPPAAATSSRAEVRPG